MYIVMKNGYHGGILKIEKVSDDLDNYTKQVKDFIDDLVIYEGDVIMILPDDEIE